MLAYSYVRSSCTIIYIITDFCNGDTITFIYIYIFKFELMTKTALIFTDLYNIYIYFLNKRNIRLLVNFYRQKLFPN